MKAPSLDSPPTTSLLGLYLERKEELFARIDQQRPDQAADQVSDFIRAMERPYTDAGREPAHLAHHVLNTVAAASQTLLAVEATATNPNQASSGRSGQPRSTSWVSTVGSTSILFLWGVTLACVLAVVLILTGDPDPAIVPIVCLIVIALLATVGATTAGSGKVPALTPRVTRYVDVPTLDKKISHALRVADELLDAARRAQPGEEKKSDHPALEPKRTLELLQALAAHRMTKHPEKGANELAGEAIRLLFNAKVNPVEYTEEQTDLFEHRPAGVNERRTLLPALVDEQGELVCEGVVLVPVSSVSDG